MKTPVRYQPIDGSVLHHQTGGNPIYNAKALGNHSGAIPLTARDAGLERHPLIRLYGPAGTYMRGGTVQVNFFNPDGRL